MRRRQLVAMAVAGALTSILATATVSTAALVAPQAPPAGRVPVQAAVLNPAPPATEWKPRKLPLVIAHRGASAYKPEHTVGAYRVAAEMGADYIEADLEMTRDGQLVARHEHELAATTDVANHPEFAARRRTLSEDGKQVTDWFTEDFTVAELKTLRAKARRGSPAAQLGMLGQPQLASPPARAAGPADPATATGLPSEETLVTVTEIIALAGEESAKRGTPVGLYLELKTPAYFAGINLAPEPVLVRALNHGGLPNAGAPVFVESYDADSLRKVHAMMAVPLIQLTSTGDPNLSTAGLAKVHKYATGIGVERSSIRTQAKSPSPRVEAASDAGDDNLVTNAHAQGLEVHVFTFSNNAVSKSVDPTGHRPTDPPALAEALAEYRQYYGLGVDGVFTDNPDTAVLARA